MRNFAIGYMISVVINVGRSIRQLVYRPWRIASLLVAPKTFRLPLFLGCLPLLYNVTRNIAVYTNLNSNRYYR